MKTTVEAQGPVDVLVRANAFSDEYWERIKSEWSRQPTLLEVKNYVRTN